MNIENVVIKPHAMERFKQRYQALKGVSLTDTEATDEIRCLMAKAKPEEENPVLQLRRDSYGGKGQYLVLDRWRLVFSDEQHLETCEVRPRKVLLVKNPYIPPLCEKTRFSLKIKVDRRKSITEITRSFDKKTLHLRNVIEINVIMRALRFLGLEVDNPLEPGRLEIVVPQDLPVFRVDPLTKPDEVTISLGRQEELFPLGLQKLCCAGINKRDLDKIIDFIQINKPQ